MYLTNEQGETALGYYLNNAKRLTPASVYDVFGRWLSCNSTQCATNIIFKNLDGSRSRAKGSAQGAATEDNSASKKEEKRELIKNVLDDSFNPDEAISGMNNNGVSGINVIAVDVEMKPGCSVDISDSFDVNKEPLSRNTNGTESSKFLHGGKTTENEIGDAELVNFVRRENANGESEQQRFNPAAESSAGRS